MDSLTQIILGAACGEIVLGKKIGNKALLFGAIGGTIPDLDVFIGKLLYNNEIQAMAFHRGFMHSIFFSILGAFLFGWLSYQLYNTGVRKETTTLKNWILLFFWAIFTHPILDSFTPYGTQLFAPITNYRIAFNTISVADPLYTLPFLICMIAVLFIKRTSTKRMQWTKAGIYISSCYLIFTIGNKIFINTVFKKSYEKANINYNRFTAQPTILNNILWYAVAETENEYHFTFYSLLDKSETANNIITIHKNHNLIGMTAPNLQTLSWFSNGYFNIYKRDKTGTYKYVDLRYPPLNPDDVKTSVFNFTVFHKNNEWDILPFMGKAPKKEDFKLFLARIKGIN
ncbi:metal-dependent hydrolase [uncultured Polaribacter sp.]|uniref:metal-dependent hydrolase n=1 Tax=uncultured Polaribacter sp. TaxID=174711 RepID=UPI0026292117|nr:metal-dependent hydrolase [uncultured Polaribacter sp.]